MRRPVPRVQPERQARPVRLARPAPPAVRGELVRLARWVPQALPVLLVGRPARLVRKALPARQAHGDTQGRPARPAPGARQAR